MRGRACGRSSRRLKEQYARTRRAYSVAKKMDCEAIRGYVSSPVVIQGSLPNHQELYCELHRTHSELAVGLEMFTLSLIVTHHSHDQSNSLNAAFAIRIYYFVLIADSSIVPTRIQMFWLTMSWLSSNPRMRMRWS